MLDFSSFFKERCVVSIYLDGARHLFVLEREEIEMDLQAIYDKILKTGITKYKTLHSKASLPERVKAEKEDKKDKKDKKGAIFVVKRKEDFLETKVRGYIITSKETLLEDAATLSHFTPNVYNTFTYTDDKRQFISGFTEENLIQINTFVVDIDTKKYTREDILMACLEESIGLPTFIVETDRGYQVYFVLVEPLFISNKNEFRGLKVAKRISDNLKRSLKSVEADPFCNDFGFFRLPKPSNIVFCQLDITYSMDDFINWSMRQDDDMERPLFVVPTSGAKKVSIMHTEWFNALIHAVDIKGKKGQIGRNNTLFTLALACLQEGWSKDRTMDFLDEFNYRLNSPLTGSSLKSVLESAYSGKYHGPAKEYVEELLAIYVPHRTFDVQLGAKCWYKFKKERSERERSHYDEWEQDLIEYLTAEFNVSEPFIWRTQKEICEAIGIPTSTLNELIKKSTKIVRTVTGKGRNKKTGWSTVSLFMKHVLFAMQTAKQEFKLYLQSIQQEEVNDCVASPAKRSLVDLLTIYIQQDRLTGIDESVVNTS